MQQDKSVTPEKIRMLAFYRFLAILLLGIILGIVLSKTALAYDELKWRVCSGLNVTGGNCDDFWFQLKGQVEGNTTLSNYYNKTELDSRLNVTVNLTNYYTRAELDAMLKNQTVFLKADEFYSWRGNASDLYATKSDLNRLDRDSDDSKNQDNNGPWIIGGAILLVVLGGFYYMNNKNKQEAFQPYNRSYQPMINHGQQQIQQPASINPNPA